MLFFSPNKCHKNTYGVFTRFAGDCGYFLRMASGLQYSQACKASAERKSKLCEKERNMKNECCECGIEVDLVSDENGRVYWKGELPLCKTCFSSKERDEENYKIYED